MGGRAGGFTFVFGGVDMMPDDLSLSLPVGHRRRYPFVKQRPGVPIRMCEDPCDHVAFVYYGPSEVQAGSRKCLCSFPRASHFGIRR